MRAKRRDRRIFRKTAIRTKAINSAIKPMRGGQCL